MNDDREKAINDLADRLSAETGLPREDVIDAARDLVPKPARRVAPSFALAAMAMALMPMPRDLAEPVLVDRPRGWPLLRPETPFPRERSTCAVFAAREPRSSPRAEPDYVVALRENRAAKMARRDERARSAGKLPEGGST